MTKIKGEIEETDEIRETSKPGSYKFGIKIAGNWYGVFGPKDYLDDLVKRAKVGATADIEYEMRNKYHNVKQISIEQVEPTPEQQKKLEEKAGKEILSEHRRRRIALFQEDIEDAIKILEPWKNMMDPEVHWEKVISVATTLHISGARKER